MMLKITTLGNIGNLTSKVWELISVMLRVFLVRHFKVPLKTELRFSTEFISRDVFNNSAWNYRYFIVTEMSDNFEKTEIINDEIQFTLNYIQAAVSNASSWAYLSG